MSDVTVYVDESGSTGLEVFDSVQSIYATAGVWLTPSNEDALIDIIAEARRLYKVQMQELKGGTLIKSNSGRKAILHILTACLKAGVRYSMIAVEKPFTAAAVIIEDYTDNLYNPAFPARWQIDSALKQEAAQRIYRAIPRQTLERWWRAQNGDDKAAYEAAYNSLIGQLQLVPNCADLVNGFLSVDLDRVWHTTLTTEEVRGINYSPNATTFPALLQLCQRLAETMDYRDVSIIHDEQLQAEMAIVMAHTTFRDARHFEIDLGHGNKMIFPTDRLRRLEFKESKHQLGLQAADCLAAVVRVCTEECMHPNAAILRQFRPLLRDLYLMNTEDASVFVSGPLDWQSFASRALTGS
jgi:hypothetical protein